MPRRWVLAAAVLTLPVWAVSIRVARGCSFPAVTPHTLNPAAQASDRQPPTLMEAKAVVSRRESEQMSCGGGTVSSCGDLGTVLLTVRSTDDQTSPAEMGYRVRLTAGRLPAGLVLPTGDVRALSDLLPLHWGDSEGEAVAFTLAIWAVDLGGNLSPEVAVNVGDAGRGGCAFAPALRGSAPLAAWLGLAALALARIWRRWSAG